MGFKSALRIAAEAAVCSSVLASGAFAAQVLDQSAAVVNNDIILQSELNEATARVISNAARQKVQLNEIDARKAAMEHLITTSLVNQLAKARGITMTDMQADDALNKMAAKSGSSREQILNSFAPGQSDARKLEAFKSEMLVEQMRRESIGSRVHISDSEIDSLAKQLKQRGSIEPRYHIGQVVIPLSSAPTEAEYNRAQAQAREAAAALKGGTPLAAVAARYGSGSQNGDLGYVPEMRVPLPFVPALIKAKPGDVIGPIRSPVGLHFIKLFDVSHDAVEPIKTYDSAHILLKTSVILSDDKAKEELLDLRSQIERGEISFANAARKYSEDQGTASKGGDLGYQDPGIFDPGFAQALVELKPGQISDPVRSSYGWHLILLKDVKTDASSDEAYRSRARSILFERAFEEQAGLWERSLRDSAYVHITDPELLSAGVNLEHSAK